MHTNGEQGALRQGPDYLVEGFSIRVWRLRSACFALLSGGGGGWGGGWWGYIIFLGRGGGGGGKGLELRVYDDL